MFSIVLVCGCFLLCGYVLYKSYDLSARVQDRIYILAYLIFMIIGIVGYFTVPSVANYIVNAGGGNTLLYKVTSITAASSRTVMNTTSSAASKIQQTVTGSGNNGGFMYNKLSGKS